MLHRPSTQAGIAIGAILFVLALLAVIAAAITNSSNFMGTTITPDRLSAELKSQAHLIRNKILECFTNGYDRGELADKYPSSSGNGTLVSALECPSYGTGTESLWTGQSPASFPAKPSGLDDWYYVNAGASGGRCIRIQPSAGNTSDVGILGGLGQAASAFSSMELVYDSGSGSKRFILWITRPSGAASADCSS